MATLTAEQEEKGIRRRRSPRVVGPFTARWCGAVKVPIVLQDLGAGGCLVLLARSSLPTQIMRLEIDLPGGPTIQVDAQPLYLRANVGFAAQFVNVPLATQRQLQLEIARLSGVPIQLWGTAAVMK